MNFRFLGPQKIEEELKAVLTQVAAGKRPRDIERSMIEIKEEPGRRGPGGQILAGESRNEAAAAYLVDELACMSNTPGSGVIILGISDEGESLGTNLDTEWLRHRIYEVSDSKLTVDIREAELHGVRLLLLRPPESIEPIRSPRDRRIRWRVADNCVEVDAATWLAGRVIRSGFDWSDQPSGHRIEAASAVALEIARGFLLDASNDPTAAELAASTDADLLRRLNLVTPAGYLSNAGSLLFVDTPEPGIDYIRRDYSGADSSARVNRKGPLLTQLDAVLSAAMTANRIVHVPVGPAQVQVRAIPELALREAIVNGVVHRDWNSAHPTVVEHMADTLVVTSPGGFVPGVTPKNIITYPSTPRYRALASAISALKLAEREGIGVDRMVRDMLALGHSLPDIHEIEGPRVRVALVGGAPDGHWMEFLRAVTPETVAREVDLLLLLDLLMHMGWFDVNSAYPVLQKSPTETTEAIDRLERTTLSGQSLISVIEGIPVDSPDAWRLSNAARLRLADRLEVLAGPGNRQRLITGWARHRGRVSSTEVADLLGLSTSHSNTILTSLSEDGLLKPGRETRRGRGFYYVPVD